MLLDRAQDRVLTNAEVKQLLTEDTKGEDRDFARIKRRWKALIESKKHLKYDSLPYNLVQAEKRGDYYCITCKVPFKWIEWKFPNFLNFAFAETPSKAGLSMLELEEIVQKMEQGDPIQALLDAGYILNLIVPDKILALF